MRAFDVPKVFKATGPRANCSGTDRAPRPFPRQLAIGMAVWLALTILGTEAWYRAARERGAAPVVFPIADLKTKVSNLVSS